MQRFVVLTPVSFSSIHCRPRARQPSSLFGFQLIGQRIRVVNIAQRFDDRGGIDRDGAGLFVGKGAVEHERLDVTVENDADEFADLVYDRSKPL